MEKKKIFLNIGFSIILQSVNIICGFIIPKIIISNYGSDVNGLTTSISQFLACITLLEAGLGPVIKSVLYKPISNNDTNKIIKVLKSSEIIFRRISYFFIFYVLVLCIALPYKFIEEFDWLYTFSLIVIISISIFMEYYFGITYKLFLQAKQKTYITAIIQTTTLIVNAILVLLLVYFKQSIQVVKLGSCFIFILRPILQNIYVKKKYNINLKNNIPNYKISQKWDGLAQHIAFVAHNNADVVILTICGNLKYVSVYSVYSAIINNISNIVHSFVGGVDAFFGIIISNNKHEVLNREFRIYECFYYTVGTIIFSSTIFLIIPFVKIYTYNIKDVNYIRPCFAYLMVLAKFIYIIRQPYNDLVKVSGHFKQTRIGAYIEAISNIVISFVLVWKLGIIGVTIGTIISMFIRTIEVIVYTSRKILKRSIWDSFKNIVVIGIELILITVIVNWIPKFEIYNYITWIIYAIYICIISSIVVLLINGYIYKSCLKYVFNKLRKKTLLKTDDSAE